MPRPDRDVTIAIEDDALDSLVMLRSCHHSIALDDYNTKGSYSVVKAPLPESELYYPSAGQATVEYSAMFIIYEDSIWYVIEPKNVSLVSRMLRQDITAQVKELLFL